MAVESTAQQALRPKPRYALSWVKQFQLLFRLQISEYRASLPFFWLRLRHENDFYGTLPVKRSAFLATLFCLGLISTLPGMATSPLVGSWQLGIPPQNTLAAVPLTLLAPASLTVVGADIGGLVQTQAAANLYSNLLILVVTFLSPVLIPMEKMPRLLQVTSYLLPPGQATMAITDSLRGEYGPRFWILFGLLCLWLLVSGVIVARRLDWRAD